MGWDSRRILTPGYTEWAWVGAYLEGRDTSRGRAYTAALKPLKQRHGYSYGNPWVLWRPVPAADGPIEPDEYAAQVLGEMRTAWEQISPVIDMAAHG